MVPGRGADRTLQKVLCLPLQAACLLLGHVSECPGCLVGNFSALEKGLAFVSKNDLGSGGCSVSAIAMKADSAVLLLFFLCCYRRAGGSRESKLFLLVVGCNPDWTLVLLFQCLRVAVDIPCRCAQV